MTFTKENASEMGKKSGKTRRDKIEKVQEHCQMMADVKSNMADMGDQYIEYISNLFCESTNKNNSNDVLITNDTNVLNATAIEPLIIRNNYKPQQSILCPEKLTRRSRRIYRKTQEKLAKKANSNNKNKIDHNLNATLNTVKLYDIMDERYLVRRQKYTKATYKRFKAITSAYKKWLKQEVKNESVIGLKTKRQMIFNSKHNYYTLPKYNLCSVNADWQCDLPPIRDSIINFIKQDWNKWNRDVSRKSFVIKDILYENEQDVHKSKTYGLFAIKKIIKDTLLFEYSGCVKPLGETELQQTKLFKLIGHLNENKNKFWGDNPNDQLVIDPSRWHNEGVYVNNYKARGGKQNVKFYEVLVNNWPRIFAVATENIKPGQELLADYGDCLV